MDVASTVNVITAEDIESQPYTNIADILASQPGIDIDTSSASRVGSARIGIRGASSSQTLYVIDGVKAMDKENGDTVPFIDLSQIERIEIIKGPASVLYGSEAIGGVINIITKKGGNRPIGFSQRFVYDSSTTSVDIQSAIFGRYNGINYRVSASGVNVNNRRVPTDAVAEGELTSSNYRNRYYSAQLGYDWGNHSVSLQAERFENKSNYSLGASTYNAYNNNMGMRMSFDPNDRNTIQASLIMRDLSDYLKVFTVRSAYQEVERGWISDFNIAMMDMANMWMKGTIYSKQKQFTFTAQAEWLLFNHTLTTGIDYQLDNVLVDNITDPYNPIRNDVIAHAKVRQQMIELYAQDVWKITETFAATLGIRFGHLSGKNLRHDSNLFSKGDNERNSSHVVGSVGLVYRPMEALAFRAQFSQGYRYPTTRQLYTGTSAHGANFIGTLPNPDLKPETSNNYEVGVRYLNDNWDFDFAVFYSTAKNYIISVADPSGIATGIYANGDHAKTLGFELAAAYTFHLGEKNLTPYVSLSHLNRTFYFISGAYDKNLGEPKLQGRFGLKLDFPVFVLTKIYVDLYGIFQTKSQSDFSNFTYSVSTTVSKNKAWATANLTLGIRGGENLKYNFSIAARNIFNKPYRNSKSNANNMAAGAHVVVSAGIEY
jgi:hemoglobin/transferrin/lactoferrin receptor protein